MTPDGAAAQTRCLQMLGLAARAGRLNVGSDAVLASIRAGKARLVLLATDAGSNSEKKFRDKCAFYHIPLAQVFDRDQMGRACGRSHSVAVAVTDPGFAVKIAGLVGEFSGGDAFDETAGI